MTLTHRLARLVGVLPAARAAVIAASVDVALASPPAELVRADRLHDQQTRRPRTLANLLRRNNVSAPVRERLISRRVSRVERRVAADAVVVRGAPELPVVLDERLLALPPVRNLAMPSDPRVDQVAERREIDDADHRRAHQVALRRRSRFTGSASASTGRCAARSARSSTLIFQPFSASPAGVMPI